jgi:hypothetical protein
MKKNQYILIGSVVAIGLLAVLLLRKPDIESKARLKKLKEDSEKKLIELQNQRSLTSNFDEIVKIDAQIDTIKNKLRASGITDILTEGQISDDLSNLLNKKRP